MDLVSIIMPNYNGCKYIKEAIKSVLSQTHNNWELIIVDDFSEDASRDIICLYAKKDLRIKYIFQEQNLGVANARNVAINHSKGRYIAFLDSDDIWSENKLELQINFMRNNHLKFSYSSYYLIDEKSDLVGTFFTLSEISFNSMLKTCSVGCLTAIYDSFYLGKMYMKNIPHEDYVLWLDILKNIGTSKGVTEPLAYYRLRKKSLSSNKLKSATYQWNIYRKVLNFSLAKSIKYFVYYAINGIKKYKNFN